MKRRVPVTRLCRRGNDLDGTINDWFVTASLLSVFATATASFGAGAGAGGAEIRLCPMPRSRSSRVFADVSGEDSSSMMRESSGAGTSGLALLATLPLSLTAAELLPTFSAEARAGTAADAFRAGCETAPFAAFVFWNAVDMTMDMSDSVCTVGCITFRFRRAGASARGRLLLGLCWAATSGDDGMGPQFSFSK